MELRQSPLPVARDALEPVLSRANIDYHYGHLYKGYVDRYNQHEGSPEFNRAGAFLHDIYFTQFTRPDSGSKPGELTLDLIRKHSSSLAGLKALMKDAAMRIQGSGWVYLSTDGTIRTIKNHEVRDDIVVLIDWWEHAWNPDYLWRKAEYFDNIWRIIDWNHIEDRLGLM